MRAAALAITLCGCNAILGIGDVHTSTGSADAQPDAPTPDAAPPLTCPASSNGNVVGCWFDDYIVSPTSTIQIANDLSGYTIQAYVPDQSASGFTKFNATIIGKGIFTLDGIPAQTTYYLRLFNGNSPTAIPTFYVTDRRDLDLGLVGIGRPDATPVSAPKTVTMQMTNMTAWQAGTDYLLADSFAVDTENFVDYPAGSAINLPKPGDTMTNAGVNWQNSYGFVSRAHLLDASKHDDIWITHNVSTTVSDQTNHPWVSTSVVDYFTSTDVDMPNDSSPTTIAGAFAQAPQNLTQSFEFNMGDLRTGINDGGRYWSEDVNCALLTNVASVYRNGIGPALVGPDMVLTDNFVPTVPGLLTLPPLSYGNPYPSSWPVVMPCGVLHSRHLKTPGATKPAGRANKLSDWETAKSPFQFKTVGHAPSNVLIGGKPAMDGGAVAFDGTAPVTITWSAVTGRDFYSVEVTEAGIDAGKTSWTLIADFYTTQTSIKLPAELFTKDHFYQFQIGEVSQTASYALGHFNKSSTPNSGGSIASGIFRFSNDCGNGTMEGTEQCDTSGMSATCDPDCSLAICGDSVVNPMRGEECDDIFDGPHCDSDCTLPVCGDNHWNQAAAEQCDDGNNVDGDGCSHDCKLETCGTNGILDDFEDCDDNNKVNGDGCNAFCRIEGGWTCDTSMTPTKCTRP